MSIIVEPCANGRVRLYEGDSPHWFVECPAEQADAAIQHHVESNQKHFGDIAARQQAGDPRLVVAINHLGQLGAYSIGNPNDYPRGFGGQRWLIHFHDGRLVECVSLWFMGDVPTAWRYQIVENATLQAVKS